MTERGLIQMAKVLQQQWWAFPIPPKALDAYGKDLDCFDDTAVLAAIASLAAGDERRAPTERPPTVGQIRRRVAEMELDAPTWDEVHTALVLWRRDRGTRELRAAEWECPHGLCGGDGVIADKANCTSQHCRCRPAYLAALRGWDVLPPLIGEFMNGGHVGWSEVVRFLDEGDTTAAAQVRGRWTEFVNGAIQARVLARLGVGDGVPQIEAARDEDRERTERHGDLRRFSARAMLESGPA